MENIFSFSKLAQHISTEIQSNIKIGQILKKTLEQIPQSLIQKVISQLKKEFPEENKNILNTKEKNLHVQTVLDKILSGKYDFEKQNINLGVEFNDFYCKDLSQKIEIPEQQRPFNCLYCQEKHYDKNSSLHSHYRGCLVKINQENMDTIKEERIKSEKTKGFQPLKVKGAKSTGDKTAKVFAAEVFNKNDEKNIEKQEKIDQAKGKRERPKSSQSLGDLNIFQDD